jgi:hypothetical protein
MSYVKLKKLHTAEICSCSIWDAVRANFGLAEGSDPSKNRQFTYGPFPSSYGKPDGLFATVGTWFKEDLVKPIRVSLAVRLLIICGDASVIFLPGMCYNMEILD